MPLSQVVAKNGPLLKYLFEHVPDVKKTKIKQLLKFGAVTVNGKSITQHDHPLKAGDKIGFLSKVISIKEELKSNLSFPIVYEDSDIIVIDKPSGLLTMGTDKEKIDTAYSELTDYVRTQSKDGRGRVFIVHRLDRDASGLLVFAKNEASKLALQENWQESVKKYFAITEGVPKVASGKIESYLVEDKFRRVYSVNERSREAKHAVTHYHTLKQSGGLSQLDIALVTGRKNQIRVQLADLGHPIIGDKKYGSSSDPARRLGLHAYHLAFKHPVTGELKSFKSPLPWPLASLFPSASKQSGKH